MLLFFICRSKTVEEMSVTEIVEALEEGRKDIFQEMEGAMDILQDENKDGRDKTKGRKTSRLIELPDNINVRKRINTT